jgi:hypothetical protein
MTPESRPIGRLFAFLHAHANARGNRNFVASTKRDLA